MRRPSMGLPSSQSLPAPLGSVAFEAAAATTSVDRSVFTPITDTSTMQTAHTAWLVTDRMSDLLHVPLAFGRLLHRRSVPFRDDGDLSAPTTGMPYSSRIFRMSWSRRVR